MEEPVFKLPPTSWVGRYRVDAQWMMGINEKAKRLEEACKPVKQGRKKKVEDRQLCLPGLSTRTVAIVRLEA